MSQEVEGNAGASITFAVGLYRTCQGIPSQNFGIAWSSSSAMLSPPYATLWSL